MFIDNNEDLFQEDYNLESFNIKDNIPSFSSIKLCEVIVCNRYLGLMEDISIICMQELANRRMGGDDFDFESYINDAFNDLPKLDFDVPKIDLNLNSLKSIIGNLASNFHSNE